jgi:hypothetical protein
MGKYLDYEGLEYLWSKIKAKDAANQSTTNTALAQKGGYIEYDETNQRIKLWASEEAKNIEGATPLSSFSTAAFIKDGMLDDVDIVTSSESLPIKYGDKTYKDGTRFIGFTWNTEAGAKKDYLKIDEIGKTYDGSDSINISDDNKISVTNVANASVTKNTIKVEGGPLADILKSAGITEIDSTMDMTTLLLKLACKEKWPTSTPFSAGSITASLAKPSFTLSNSGSTVEVGTKCTMGAVSIPSAVSINNPTYPQVTGFTNGYSSENDNTKDSTDTFVKATMVEGSKKLNDDNYTMSITFTKFTKTDKTTPDTINVTADADHTKVKYDSSIDLLVTQGDNKVKASIAGPKALVEFNDIAQYYVVSNLGNTTNSETGEPFHRSSAQTGLSYTSSQPTNNLELTVTGKYYYFAGYINDNELTSDNVRALSGFPTAGEGRIAGKAFLETTGLTLASEKVTLDKGTKVAFAIPTGYKLSLIESLSGSEQVGTAGVTKTTISVNTGEITTSYDVYTMNSGNSFKLIKIYK